MTKQEAIDRIKATQCWKFSDDDNGNECNVCLDNDGLCEDCEYHIAIECIEKQIPKEAECHVSGNGWYGWFEFTCPVCGKVFKDSLVCPSCYQRVQPFKESNDK